MRSQSPLLKRCKFIDNSSPCALIKTVVRTRDVRQALTASRSELPRRTMANEDKTRSPEGEELYTCLVRHLFLINSSIA